MEDGAEYRPWGYTYEEINTLLHATLLTLVPDESLKLNFVIHDFGSIVGLRYENTHPERVKSIVCLDVGIGVLTPQTPILQMFIILLYQSWYAVSYILSQLIHPAVGQMLFFFFALACPNFLKACPHDKVKRKTSSMKVEMCYLYYSLFKAVLGKKLEIKFPSCKLLFMYGKQ